MSDSESDGDEERTHRSESAEEDVGRQSEEDEEEEEEEDDDSAGEDDESTGASGGESEDEELPHPVNDSPVFSNPDAKAPKGPRAGRLRNGLRLPSETPGFGRLRKVVLLGGMGSGYAGALVDFHEKSLLHTVSGKSSQRLAFAATAAKTEEEVIVAGGIHVAHKRAPSRQAHLVDAAAVAERAERGKEGLGRRNVRRLQPLPRHLVGAAAACGSEREFAPFYVCGGDEGDDSATSQATGALRRMKVDPRDDVETWPWEEAKPMSTERTYHSFGRITEGKLVAAGGLDSCRRVQRSVECYQAEVDRWLHIKDLPSALFAHAASFAGGRMLVCGGVGEAGAGAAAGTDTYFQDAREGDWHRTASLGEPRSFHCLVSVSSFRLSQGGDFQDAREGDWHRTASLGEPRSFHCLVSVSSFRLSQGGDFQDAREGDWHRTASLGEPRSFHCLVSVSSFRLSQGGDFQDAREGDWHRTASLGEPRSFHCLVSVSSFRLSQGGDFQDAREGDWHRTASLGEPRSFHCLVSVSSFRLSQGGDFQDAREGDWHRTASLGEPRSFHCLVSVSSFRLSQGGDFQDAREGDWHRTASLGEPRSFHCLVSVSSFRLSQGGDFQDAREGDWHRTASLGEPRSFHCLVSVSSFRLSQGGDFQDAREGDWHRTASLGEPRSFHCLVSVSSFRLSQGGDFQDAREGDWHRTASLGEPRSFHGLVTTPGGQRVYAVGGMEGEASGSAEELDLRMPRDKWESFHLAGLKDSAGGCLVPL